MLGKIWKRSHLGKSFVVGLTALALAVAVGSVWTAERGNAASAAVPALASPARDAGLAAMPAGGTFAPVVKKAAPAVVSIQAERTAKVSMPQSPLDFFFGPQGPPEEMERRQRGMGSGVIVSADGYVLTNHHVIENAEKVKVILSDEREIDAKIVGTDAKTDIAVLKLNAADLPALQFGNSDSIEVGDIVLAIGNPFGLGQTVTMGIVGATGRQFGIMARQQGYEDFIQTDAAINPGNSGGALVNANGELIGINTAILSRSGGNQGVGFAVPINLAHHVMTQLMEKGRVVRGYMGVGITDISAAMAQKLGAPDSRGAVVSSVEPGGPADKAGFKEYDVIRKVNGQDVRNSRDLRLNVANTPPGEVVEVAVMRDGKLQNLSITLGELPSDDAVVAEAEGGSKSALEGVSVEEITPEIRQRLRLGNQVTGVVVSQVAQGSRAAEAGLRPGDVIQEVERKPVNNVAEFRSAVRSAGGEALLLRVRSQGGSRLVIIEP